MRKAKTTGRGRTTRGREQHALIEKNVQAFDSVIKGTGFRSPAQCLIDYESTHSFVAPHFAHKLHVMLAFMDVMLYVMTPLGDSMDACIVCNSCSVRVGDMIYH